MAQEIDLEALKKAAGGTAGASNVSGELSDDLLAGVTGGGGAYPGDFYLGHCDCGCEIRMSQIKYNSLSDLCHTCPQCGKVTHYNFSDLTVTEE